MGSWGYGPFSNDRVLDDLGGYTDPRYELGKLERALDSEYYNGPLEVAALMIDTFKGFHTMHNESSEVTHEEIACAIEDGCLATLVNEKLCESTWTWLSACGLSLRDRVELLVACKKRLTGNHTLDEPLKKLEAQLKNKTAQDAIKITPNELKSLDTVYNKTRQCIGLDELIENLRPNFFKVKEYKEYRYSNKLGRFQCRFAFGKNDRGTYELILDSNEIRTMCASGIVVNDANSQKLLKEIGVSNDMQVKIVDVIKDKSKIVGYVLMNTNGIRANMAKDELKERMRNNEFVVVNATLSKNNRLFIKR